VRTSWEPDWPQRNVSVERTRIECKRHALCESDGADVEHRPRRLHRRQPSSHFVGRRHTNRGIAERLVLPLKQPTLEPCDSARRVRGPGTGSGRSVGRRQRHLRHIPETALAPAVLHHDVAADTHVEAIHRDVEDEVPSVNRRCQAFAVMFLPHSRSVSPACG
jgi:hypothetical protein